MIMITSVSRDIRDLRVWTGQHGCDSCRVSEEDTSFRWAGHQGQVYNDQYMGRGGDHYHEPESVWHDGYDYGYEDHLPPPHDPYHQYRDNYRLRNRDYSPSMQGYK